MKNILILVIASVLFGCTSTGNINTESKQGVKSDQVKSKHSERKTKIVLSPTSSTAVIRSIRAKHIFDQKTIASSLEKVFDENGKAIYETPLITWNGSKPAISLPAGNYQVLIGCWANGGNVYNYQRINAHIENEKDYTFFCLKETGKVIFGMKGIIGLYAFYSETSQLEVNMKKYQSEIDKTIKQ